MEKITILHRKIAPELVGVLEERYNILRQIRYAQPIGRRALATAMDTSERVARRQIDFLKSAGLIEWSALGMSISNEGNEMLDQLDEYIRSLHGLSEMEQELAEKLGLKRVIIIHGDSHSDMMVQRELGRTAASVLGQYLGNTKTIAVSGGSTMACVAELISFHAPGTMVVPARGGLGEKIEYQANTIAAVMAAKLGGRYRLLHIPDWVGADALEAILNRDPKFKSVFRMIKQADILLTGVGEVDSLATRGLGQDVADYLERSGAAGEMLGHYCTLKGDVVYTTSGVGLLLEDFKSIDVVIVVAGGSQKARAIKAVVAAGGQDVLVTDEAAARVIREIK